MNRKTIGQSVAVFLAVLALLFSAGSAIAGGRGSLPQSPGEPIRAFLPGPLGHQAVAEDQPGRGFLLLRLDGQPGVHFQGFPHAGKQVSWSPDGRWIGFKQIASGQQVAMVYDTRSGRLLDLTAPSPRCGVPSFADRLVAVSRGTRVLLYDRNFRLLREIGLGHYANLVRLSPDGQRLAWNDSDDQIWITWLATGKSRRISDGTQGYFNPLWQPRGGGLLFQGWNEQLFYYSPASGRVKNLGAGAHPSWSPDGQWVFCSRATWNENGFIADRDIWAVRVADGWEQNLTKTPDRFEDYPALRSGVLLFRAGDQQLFRQPLLYRNGTWRCLREEPLQQPPVLRTVTAPLRQKKPPLLQKSADGNPLQAPYIHQVYDTPNWFNGHWACGATSAMMALCYYQILPDWPTQCNWPYLHTSTHGRYICEVYSFNGYTYNIGTPDPNGNLGYGGYGFITRNNWANTKAYMAQYFQQHRLASTVDWSPSWGDLKREIGRGFPFVLLNSLTSAGHYILVLGYDDAHHSVTVNDPYGNKNQGYMNYAGKGVTYDMPGYNNGHENLNTVWCFIYARALPDLAVSDFAVPDTLDIGNPLPLQLTVRNTGIRPAADFAVEVLLSPDPTIDASDSVLYRTQIAGLDTQQIWEQRAEISLPGTLPSGTYAIAQWADPDRSILEVTERNNVRWRPAVIRGVPRLLQVQPAEGAVLDQNPVTIFVRYEDPVCGIRASGIQLWIDGSAMGGELEASQDQLFWQGNLAPGEHTVRLVIPNNEGHSLEKEWSFRVGSGTSVAARSSSPESFSVRPVFPNPVFADGADPVITLQLPKAGTVTVQLFSLLGRTVAQQTLEISSGTRQVHWSELGWQVQQLSAGIYWLTVRSVFGTASQKIVLLAK